MSAYTPPQPASAPVAQIITASSDYPTSLSALTAMRGSASRGDAKPAEKLRNKAIEEASEIFGAQSGYCAEVKQYDSLVMNREDILSKVFNFNSLLLDGGRVLPPIIAQEDQTFSTTGPAYAVTTQKLWKILQDPMIVSAAPDWRQYLQLTCTPPNQPNPLLLPVSDSDIQSWTAGAKKGWAAGVKQAKEAEKLGMARLVRDYTGMLRFTSLYERGLVSAPILATGHAAVVVGNHTMRVGETIFRLTATSGFDSKHAATIFSNQIVTTP